MWQGGIKMKKYIVFFLILLILTVVVGYAVQGINVKEEFKNCVGKALEDAEGCLLKIKTKQKEDILSQKDKVADCQAKAMEKLEKCKIV